MADLRHIETWVFDLDNTLYDAQYRLFDQIDARMTAFIRDRLSLEHTTARKLQKDYYVQYGTTMRGLMVEHDVCPDTFMDYVHDIDLTPIPKSPALGAALDALPGRKLIYTNGSYAHAENVAGALGVFHHFDDVFDIKSASYNPKPNRQPYEKFLSDHDVNPASAIMFEDLMQNLEAPHALGMTTVLVCSDAAWLADEPAVKRPAQPGDDAPHIHFTTNNLTAFLQSAQTGAKIPA